MTYVSDVVSVGSKKTVYVVFPAFRSSSGIDSTVPCTYFVVADLPVALQLDQ